MKTFIDNPIKILFILFFIFCAYLQISEAWSVHHSLVKILLTDSSGNGNLRSFFPWTTWILIGIGFYINLLIKEIIYFIKFKKTLKKTNPSSSSQQSDQVPF